MIRHLIRSMWIVLKRFFRLYFCDQIEMTEDQARRFIDAIDELEKVGRATPDMLEAKIKINWLLNHPSESIGGDSAVTK